MKEHRLRPKYMVYKVKPEKDGKYAVADLATGKLSTDPSDVDSPFVLMPAKDPAAFRAMICYARFCESSLRAEICTWLNRIAAAEPKFGSQGARNYAEMKAAEINLGLD